MTVLAKNESIRQVYESAWDTGYDHAFSEDSDTDINVWRTPYRSVEHLNGYGNFLARIIHVAARDVCDAGYVNGLSDETHGDTLNPYRSKETP